MNKYSIGQAAKIVGLKEKTIRFYEDAGVIAPARRESNGYRIYSETNIEELKMLNYAREMGLPLVEIKKLLKGCDGGNCNHSREYVKTSIDSYLSILSMKLRQMKALETRLKGLKKQLNREECTGSGAFCCNILHQLLVKNIGGENS